MSFKNENFGVKRLEDHCVTLHRILCAGNSQNQYFVRDPEIISPAEFASSTANILYFPIHYFSTIFFPIHVYISHTSTWKVRSFSA